MSDPEQTIAEVREDFNRLRGRLFQAAESWGVPKKQEDAIKGVIRHLTYTAQADLESRIRGE